MFYIVDDNGNVVFKSKSEPKTIGWMLFNTDYDTESYIGTLPSGHKVHFETR